MDLISTKPHLIENIKTLEGYLASDNAEEKQFAKDLVRKGQAQVVYKVNGENHFAPGHFLRFKNNTMANHLKNEEKDDSNDKDITSLIDKVLQLSSFANETTDTKYLAYVKSLGVKPEDNKRKFWRLKEGGSNVDLSL